MSEGNQELARIERRSVDRKIAEMTDPELRPLEQVEIEQCLSMIPDWTLKVAMSNGETVVSFERYIPKNSDNVRVVGNVRAFVQQRYPTSAPDLFFVENDISAERVTVVADLNGKPPTLKVIRALHDVDMQLALDGAFGPTNF